MGWCHEFGPQISEGCDHPMVAASASCTCQHCGTECKGKFAGCTDVWARGPRRVAVRATTLRPRTAPARSTLANGRAKAPPGLPGTAEAGPETDEAMRALLDELIGRCEAFEAVAARVDALARAQQAPHAPPEVTKALSEVGRRLDDLSARLAPLEQLPARLERVERAPRPTPAPATGRGGEELAILAREVKRLAGQLSALEGVGKKVEALEGVGKKVEALEQDRGRLPALGKKVEALEQDRGRLPALDKVLAGLVQGSERLAARVEALESAPVPDAVPAGAAPDQAALQGLVDRVAALEAAPRAEPRIPAPLVTQMERLVSQMAALQGMPERLAALERSPGGRTPRPGKAGASQELGAVITQLERLTAEVAPLRAVPKRVEAIERVQGRVNAIDKSLAKLAQEVGQLSAQAPAVPDAHEDTIPRIEALDSVLAELVQGVGRLSSQVAALDEVPKRVEALEQASSPTEKVVTSIAKRVDRLSTQTASVKELPQRLEALEQAISSDPRLEQTNQRISEIGADVQALRTVLERLSPQVQALEEAGAAAGAIEAEAPSDRNEALARGLGHAIDMIDQLAHQVAVLEEVVPARGDDPARGDPAR